MDREVASRQDRPAFAARKVGMRPVGQGYPVAFGLGMTLAFGCSFDRAPQSARQDAEDVVPDAAVATVTDHFAPMERDAGCDDDAGSCQIAERPELGDCTEQSCAACAAGAACEPDASVACEPDCDRRECGDDGCGGICGTCRSGTVCSAAGICACVAECGPRTCGNDACGASCGTCASDEICEDGTCRRTCTPDCGGRQCGDDGCGGSCGSCSGDRACNDKGRCKRVRGDDRGPGGGPGNGRRGGED